MKRIILLVTAFLMVVVVRAQDADIIFEQTEGAGGNGIVSDYYIPSSQGAYSADDFILENGTAIGSFKFQGFGGDAGTGIEPVLAGFQLFVYANTGGVPAGYPGGPVAALFELDLVWNGGTGADYGLSYEKVETEGFKPTYIVTIDIQAATGDALTLDAGTYWVVIAAKIDADPGASPAPPRFNWTASDDVNGALPKISDPQNLFGVGAAWSDINTVTDGTDFNALTFTVYGPVVIVACAGQPDAGTINAPESVCPGVGFTLSVSGQTQEGGISYQWQQSSNGGDTWTDITGAINPVLNLLNGITAVTDYRFIVECENSDETAQTDAVSIIFSPANQCYCTPVGGGNNSDEILNFTLSNLSYDSDPSEGVNGYSDYSSSVPPAYLQIGETYVASLTSGAGSGQHGAAIWIDYNDNGVLEASEMVASIPSSIAANTTVNFPAFTVGNFPGIHRLRVQYGYNVPGAGMDPCTVSTTFSETEDYSVDVTDLASCEGTPEAGVADADFSVCAGEAFNISVTGATPEAFGLVRAWESSPSGAGNWSVINGATGSTYEVAEGITLPTDYRYKLSCDWGAYVFSDIISVSLNPYQDCYCIPSFAVGCETDHMIDDFILIGGETTSIENQGTGCSEAGYDDRTDEAVTLAKGVQYIASVTSGAEGDAVAVWIDFNDNGVFDESERVGAGYLDTSTDITLTIPDDANLGDHRMRVMVAHMADPNNHNEFDPCNAAGNESGEAHDYMVTVIEYDCPEFSGNIGDACVNPDGDEGILDENCDCYVAPVYDCPELEANIGDACDDGNPDTENDMYNDDCECVGTPIIVEYDCPDVEANIGDACDDGDDMTENDVYNASCECVGTPIVSASGIAGFNFKMYPNPAGSDESVTLTSNQSIDRYEVLDITGKIIDAKIILNQNEIVIALRNYSAGMYILKAYSGSDFSTQKMVVR